MKSKAYGIQIGEGENKEDERESEDFSDIEELKGLKKEWDHLCN